MPEVAQASVQNLDSVLKEQLMESFKSLQKNSTKLNRTSMEIGWDASFLERHNAWEMFGYKHQHACRLALGLSYSNWYRVISIASCFPKLEKAEYLVMKLDSADVLGRQPEEVRYDPKYIDWASTEPIDAFKARFAPVVQETKDQISKLEIPMTRDKKEAIVEGIHEFMQEHCIDNESFALELLIAETRERPTFVGFIQDSIPKLTKAVMEAQEFEELRSLIVDHLRAMGELLKVCCGEESQI